MSLPWPDSYKCIKDAIYDKWDIKKEIEKKEIEILSEFSDGKSTARVFLVDLDAKNYRGQAILKLDTPRRWSDNDKTEAERHSQAEHDAPEYAQKHLPKLLDTCEHEGKTALLCSIAGDSLNYIQSLPRLGMEQQFVATQRLARGILEEWNRDYEVSDSACSPYVPLDSWLGYRIKPESGGRIHDFLEDKCSLNPTEKAFSFLGEWCPNPCAYAASRELWLSDHEIKLVKGKSHGDLHGHNVLVKIDGSRDYPYYLIDLALYEENTFLFYDHAYLELSHLLHYQGSAQFNRWLKILQAIAGTQPMDVDYTKVELDDHGILNILRTARQELLKWIKSREPGRREHIEGQAMLARVAVGLNFVNKTMDDRQRKLAFLYAAAHLKQYFTIFQLQWKQQGPVLDLKEPVKAPETDNWRAVWKACEQFDHHKNFYALVSGPRVRQVNPMELQVLGRIPWALVLDFDPESKHEGLFEAVSTLQGHRAYHETLPDNLLEINYKEAICWFMAAGSSKREDTLKSDYDAWRRQYVPAIREQAHRLRRFASPEPVLILILPDGLTEQDLRATWECLDEVFADEARYVVVHDGGINLETLKEKHGVNLLQCPLENLMSGLWQMYGSTSATEQVRVPGRGSSEKERIPIFLSEEDFQYLKEDLEIIHGGLVEEPQEGKRVGHDFWRGHEITWTELDMRADVQRDLVEPFKKQITEILDESRNFSIDMVHTPGAGGTTLAKRIAWDFKDLYPVVRIHHLSPHTASRIEHLFHITKLPVLVLMEAADVPSSARERLYKDLKGRNARAVFLSVMRSITPRSRFSLEDPMVEQETNRFYEIYKNIAQNRRGVLDRLAHDKQMIPYRSPFFFGLYAFEEKFVHVPDYVSSHLAAATEDAQRILCFLALLTRFSQSALRDVEIKGLLNLSTEKTLRLNEVLGGGPARLVLHRDQQVYIVHPLIAEEILQQLLGSNNPRNQDEWKARLVELSCDFIESLVNIAGSDSTNILQIFTQMFISRDHWPGSSNRRRHFSELILTIPGEAGQHRVLRNLRDTCPNEAHFWNHLGRHHIYAMRSRYEEAELCLMKAIDLDDGNDIHHHALGLVYRSEIRRRLNELIKRRATAKDGLTDIRGLVDMAEACFAKARELNPETEYGYITNIQLLAEVIERLFTLSNSQDYAKFLSDAGPVGKWCREKLPWAEELLRRVKDLQTQENLSRLTVRCEADILNFYGHFDSMIQSLQGLLKQSDIHRPPIRRAIAHAYYAHRLHDWQMMKSRDLRRIYSLMAENIEEAPTNARDLWMWFQAYRRLSYFDILEAIDQLNRWAMREESIEAHYYLYILHFLRWRQGILEDHHLVTNHISKCQALAGKVRRTYSFEWLAEEPTWCPLAHYSELGEWDNTVNFYKNTEPLALVNGTVKYIKGPQSGLLALGPFEVFFVPGYEYLPGRDENEDVQFYLGFSYDGLRGWSVHRINH